MKLLIEEINSKLLIILDDLKGRKIDLESSLSMIQEKIDSKIEEAKTYKLSVDSAKEEIKALEGEIESFEKDLVDITDKFSNKDLNAILETAHKEINAKIAIRAAEINKCRERINELTEKARMIKDLLVSLKKDKDVKKNKLADLEVALNYYETELTKIIDYSEQNPDDLIPKEEEDYNFEINSIVYDVQEVVDDTPVFDEIKSIEDDENNEDNDENVADFEEEDTEDDESGLVLNENFEEDVDEEIEESLNEEVEDKNNNFELDLNIEDDEDEVSIFDLVNQDEVKNEVESKTEEETEKVVNTSLEDEKEELENVSKEENNQSDIVSLFEHDKTMQIDFKTLNDEIDKEYENIFGDSLTDFDNYVPNDDDFFNFNLDENHQNVFDEKKENIETQKATEASVDESIDNFFKNNNLDFSKFCESERVELTNIYSKNKFQKVIDVLNRNNISLENIYSAALIFDVPANELESMINKLLLANQTTENIGLILETLPLINNFDLNEVIESYKDSVKDANIVDIIVKAKHLKDIGGAR